MPTLIISIIVLSIVLAWALYTLNRRNTITSRSPVWSPPPVQTVAGTPALSHTVEHDVVIAALFQSPAIFGDQDYEAKQCQTCRRIFGGRSDFCYVDGSVLAGHLPFAGEFWICTHCGHEGRSICDCEQGTFRVQSEKGEIIPMVPIARCSLCQDLGTVGSICERDQVERTPVFEMNFRTFPPQGFGPRRTICLHCGLQFSRVAKYCSSDGHRLSLLN